MSEESWDNPQEMDSDETRVYAERPNKTAIKREMLALRDLGKRLAALSPSRLDEVPLDDKLRDAIVLARRLKKGALKRQFIFIEKLMRPLSDDEVGAIRDALDQIDQPHRDEVERLHRLESWRDRLIAGDDELLNELVETYPAAERQHIRQLVRNANREAAVNKPPRASRALFQYLDGLT
jgi:ribosome-associated protein